MFINFFKVTFFTLVGSVLMIGNITLVNAKPNLCKPPVTIPTICSDCHNGNPGKSTYIPNACVTVLNKPGNNGGNGNNNGG
ncbi:MAG: hypothetical protein ACC657_14105, partial [Thiohalomonadales bacterium]